ncbi:MAG: hypothetical protein OHK0053_12910 [Microscillaceae bacterium]
MDYGDDRLQRYLNKMMLLQDAQREKPLSDGELKQIALETGMSESDWQASQEAAQGYLKSGKGHLTFGNWVDAVRDLEQANALMPNSLEANYALAQAYKGYWMEKRDPSHKEMAEKYANRALQIRPDHAQTIGVLNDLREGEKQAQQSKTMRRIVIGAVVGGLFLLMMIFYILTNNAAVSQAEEVAKKWAQVENVYQRRADLIPKLVQTAQAAANFEREILEKLKQAQSRLQAIRVDADKLSGEDLAQFQKGQSELSASLNQLLLLAQKNPELSASQAFRDLLVQIEGSENRISVERKRFNEAVSDYNSYIKRFPASLLGLDEKAYFKMDTGADQSPSINLK